MYPSLTITTDNSDNDICPSCFYSAYVSWRKYNIQLFPVALMTYMYMYYLIPLTVILDLPVPVHHKNELLLLLLVISYQILRKTHIDVSDPPVITFTIMCTNTVQHRSLCGSLDGWRSVYTCTIVFIIQLLCMVRPCGIIIIIIICSYSTCTPDSSVKRSNLVLFVYILYSVNRCTYRFCVVV